MNNQEPTQTPPPEQNPNPERLPQPVYYVESTDPTVLVAMDVWVAGNTFSWFDTVKERVMQGKIIEKTPEKFAFVRHPQEGGATYTFTPLTLDIYDRAVKSRLAGGKDFDNQQSMVEAFLRSFKNAW